MEVTERILSHRIEGNNDDRKPEIYLWTQSDRKRNQKKIPLFHAEGQKKRDQVQAVHGYF